jgi:hypothetical protein
MKKMPFMSFLGFCLALPFHLLLGDIQTEEKAFYALSALQSYIGAMAQPSEHGFRGINLDDNDIAGLWAKASRGPFGASIDKVSKKYYQALDKRPSTQARMLVQVADSLMSIWRQSNGALLEKIIVADKRLSDERFFLPDSHWLKGALDDLFARGWPLKNRENFFSAGFTPICQRSSSMVVAAHDLIPGYLIKAYLDEEKRNKDRSRKWLINRCLGAENVRNLIQSKRMKYFTVPEKWIYILPGFDALNDHNNAVLVVTNMQLTSEEKTKWAWKNVITKKHLDELYCILSHGFSSTYLVGNIPYTKQGTFTCIDTEYPERKLPFDKVSSYLSDDMRAYWESLVRQGGKP